MRGEVEALLAKARRSLANARLSFDAGDFDFAASRAYYAMFYAAEAALLSRGLEFAKHGSVIAEFNRHFVKEGRVPEKHGLALRTAFEQRLVGDYMFSEPFPRATAAVLLEAARSFLDDVGDYLGGTAS